jgi:hypothetical protein
MNPGPLQIRSAEMFNLYIYEQYNVCVMYSYVPQYVGLCVCSCTYEEQAENGKVFTMQKEFAPKGSNEVQRNKTDS